MPVVVEGSHPRKLAVLLAVMLGLGALFQLGAPSLVAQESTAPFPRNEALYLTMRDGVKIAIDVWLPSDLAPGERIPTITRATRYWRARDRGGRGIESDNNYEEAERFNGRGFALVLIDARGSGASFGMRPFELSEDEVRDYGEVVEWIVTQPWSNRRVGGYGVSYSGNTAEMLAVNRHPAVKAVAPLFNDFDNFEHLVFPNGLLTVGFLQNWGESVHHMDRNDICGVNRVTGARCSLLKDRVTGVKPVDADVDRRLLAAAVRDHQENTHPYYAALEYEFRDDSFGPHGARDVGYRRSPAGHLPDIEASGVAMFVRVGWLDAATVNGALGRYPSIGNRQRVFIGAWDHGARNNADPFLPVDTPVWPSPEDQFSELIEFFESLLTEAGTEEMDSKITYYTLGSGEWSTTSTWPPSGFTPRHWYFHSGGALRSAAPGVTQVADRYTVDYEATTGTHNRWYTNGGAGDVIYPDRREEDKKLFTYTSEPMERDVEITGHPVVTLFVTSTHTDGAFIVYLEDVAPDGRVTYITEGQLRAVMRKVTDEPPLYRKYGPHRTERRADAMPLVPGEVAELTFDLWATSVVIKRQHRIRVAIAGADKDTFLRYPRDGGVPTITIERGRQHPSGIVLPMKER